MLTMNKRYNFFVFIVALIVGSALFGSDAKELPFPDDIDNHVAYDILEQIKRDSKGFSSFSGRFLLAAVSAFKVYRNLKQRESMEKLQEFYEKMPVNTATQPLFSRAIGKRLKNPVSTQETQKMSMRTADDKIVNVHLVDSSSEKLFQEKNIINVAAVDDHKIISYVPQDSFVVKGDLIKRIDVYNQKLPIQNAHDVLWPKYGIVYPLNEIPYSINANTFSFENERNKLVFNNIPFAVKEF